MQPQGFFRYFKQIRSQHFGLKQNKFVFNYLKLFCVKNNIMQLIIVQTMRN